MLRVFSKFLYKVCNTGLLVLVLLLFLIIFRLSHGKGAIDYKHKGLPFFYFPLTNHSIRSFLFISTTYKLLNYFLDLDRVTVNDETEMRVVAVVAELMRIQNDKPRLTCLSPHQPLGLHIPSETS